MKKFTSLLSFAAMLLVAFISPAIVLADVTATTATVAATNLPQGSTQQVLYIAQLDVTGTVVTVNGLGVTISGTHDNDDITIVGLWFNATSASLSGATNLTNLTGTFAGPHTFNFNINRAFAAGTSGYFIVTATLSNSATHNNTIKINGAANPIIFSFTTAPVYTNNQTDAGGLQTIQAADAAVSSVAVPAAILSQGLTTQPIAITRVDVTSLPATVDGISVTVGGTHDNNDLTIVGLWFNATSPTLAGATNLTNLTGTFAGPHTYNFNVNRAFSAGSTGYFILTTNLSNSATHNNTIKVDAATNPIVVSFVTSPNYTNTQTDVAGLQTIQAADVAVSSIAVPAASLPQGITTQPIAITRLDVTTLPVTADAVSVTLSGTHDNNDLTIVGLWFNATSPVLAGATNLTNLTGTFAGPHTYNFNINRAFSAGATGYFIITTNLSNSATHNNTIKVDAVANPIAISFVTAPNYTNTQTDIAGLQTIQAADAAVSSIALPAASLPQGATTQPISITRLDVTTLPVTVDGVSVTLTGTHDNNDITIVGLWFNATAPLLAGATNLTNLTGTFAGPHTYNFNINRAISAGGSGYFIITTNIANSATHNNTIKVDAVANPVAISFVTAPNYTNTQTDIAGLQTIQAADANISSIALGAALLPQGATTQIVSITKVDINTLPATVDGVSITFGGTHDANDLTIAGLWFNATAPTLAGATNLTNLTGTFAGPHTYNFNVNRQFSEGSTGYFLVTTNISNSATPGNTIKVDAAANPVAISFVTSPNFTNTQTDIAGLQTIQAAAVSVSTVPGTSGVIGQGANTQPIYVAQLSANNLPIVVDNIQATLTGTHDANDLTIVGLWFNATSPVLAGATNLTNLTGSFAAPHTYNFNINTLIAAGGGGYFIVTVNTSATATLGNTVLIDGSVNPLVFGFVTAPIFVNNQSNIAGNFVIPVTLSSLKAKQENNAVAVQWTTASEYNNAYFEVQHSTDGVYFETLGKVTGKGNTTSGNTYSYTHRLPDGGNNFYRLKQVDIDNKATYSDIVLVTIRYTKDIVGLVSPNPVINLVRISIIAKDNKKMALRITDQLGRVILSNTRSLVKGTNNIQVDAARIAAGNYRLQVLDETGTSISTQQLIIQH